MFDSPFRSRLEILLDDQVLRFDSAADFAFAIEGRSDVCGEDSATLTAMSDEMLRVEIAQLEAEDASLSQYFEDALDRSERLDERLAGIDPRRWRCEHRWNEILGALARTAASAHAMKRHAVVTYLGYLRTRAAVANALVTLRDERRRKGAEAEAAAIPRSAPFADGNGRDVPLARGQATLVLDCARDSALIRFSQHLHRLVRTRSSTLVDEPLIELVDDGGKRWRVAPGLSRVGRDARCEIGLRAAHKDISRAHAILKLDDSDRVWITDTSSKGTYIVQEQAPGSEG